MFDEGEHGARDAVAEGLVAGHREEEEHRLELFDAELGAVVAGLEEEGNDVVAWVGSPMLGERVCVGIEVGQARPSCEDLGARRRVQDFGRTAWAALAIAEPVVGSNASDTE